MKEAKLVKLAVSLSLSTLIMGTAMASDTPDYVRINEISYGGSGCPQGTVGKNIAGDGKAFTLTFSEFLAESGPGIPAGYSRSNCQITVDLDFPQGWTYSVAKFDYRGYAYLDKKVKATQKSTYYFQGEDEGVDFVTTLKGEYDDDFENDPAYNSPYAHRHSRRCRSRSLSKKVCCY